MKQVTKAAAVMLMAASLGEMGMAQTNSASPAAPKTWVDSITFKGDLRYRYESISDDSKLDSDGDTYTRQRERIRARIGAEAKCNDDLKAGIEFSTGQEDPVSGNQSLGDGFGKKEFRLNLAYLDYSFLGDNPNELHGIAGKMKNPFITMPDDLVWDGDLTPEGLALKGQYTLGMATLLANGGYMWVEERSADDDDLMLYAGQLAAQLQLAKKVALTVGASYYGFQNMKGYNVMDWEDKNNAYGNSTVAGSVSGGVTNKAWANDYSPVVLFAKLDIPVFGVPVSLYVQELTNDDADSLDQGHLYGVALGKAKSPGTWEVGYNYAKLEKDATVGMFADSDRWGGGTDGQGHKVFGKYQVMKNLQAGVSYFKDDKGISGSEKDYDRVQVDLVASF